MSNAGYRVCDYSFVVNSVIVNVKIRLDRLRLANCCRDAVYKSNVCHAYIQLQCDSIMSGHFQKSPSTPMSLFVGYECAN